MFWQTGTVVSDRKALRSDLHPQIINFTLEIAKLARQFSNLPPQIVNCTLEIFKLAQQFSVALRCEAIWHSSLAFLTAIQEFFAAAFGRRCQRFSLTDQIHQASLQSRFATPDIAPSLEESLAWALPRPFPNVHRCAAEFRIDGTTLPGSIPVCRATVLEETPPLMLLLGCFPTCRAIKPRQQSS